MLAVSPAGRSPIGLNRKHLGVMERLAWRGHGTASGSRVLRTSPVVAVSLVRAALKENESGQCRQMEDRRIMAM